MSETQNESKEEQYKFSYLNYPIDNGLVDDSGNQLPRPFPKAQMKKWLKKIKWDNRKAEKRAREKLKAKKRRIEAKVNNIDIGPSRKFLKKLKDSQTYSNVSIIIDLSFDHLMIEKDRFKLIKQILRSYSLNRRSLTPLRFILTNFCGRIKKEFSRHNGYENWDVKYFDESYLEHFEKDKLIYLTSESENEIQKFEPDHYYIIGGLVDHNEHKGLCHQIACEQGLKHARLPLDKYVEMSTRKVLTVDHVFEIVLRISEGLDWPETLKQVLPERKGATIKSDEDEISNESTGNR